MNFNAATFLDVTHVSDRTVQRLGHADDIDHLPRVDASRWTNPVRTAQRAPVDADVAQRVQALEQAAARFAVRRDSFAVGKSATCLDLAAKLERFGSFVSDKQDDFARKLVEWSLPRAQQAVQEAPGAPIARLLAPAPVQAPVVRLERLFDLMQRLSKLTIGEITIARKNQDSLCWVKVANAEGVMGKIEGGVLSLFTGRILKAGVEPGAVAASLRMIEADPEAAAALHGKASGRCSVCSRDLTDPASIERGIGPVCAEKFAF
jgi:hypothetical protein